MTLLVKGSRFMRMERVVAALTGEAAGGSALMLLASPTGSRTTCARFNVFSYITLRAVLAA